MKAYPLAIRYLVYIVLISAIIAVLSITKKLLVPLAISVFLTYLLYPTARRLEKAGLPRIPTNIIVIVAFLGSVFAFTFFLIKLFEGLTNDLPQLSAQFSSNINVFQNKIEELLGIDIAQQKEIIKTAGLNGDYFSTLITEGKNLIITLALIPVYTYLMLFYRNKFREFFSMVVKSENEKDLQSIIDKAAEIVPKYLKGLFIVCFVLFGLNTLGFYLIGVKYFLLFGVVAAIFNFIPYLGTLLGYGIVLFFVLGVQTPSVATAVVVQFFIVQFLEHNIITPNITGSYVQINPFVIIFSLIAGGLVWNLPGMFLVIPTLGMLKIIFETIESTKPYAFLLGTTGTEKHSIAISALRKRFGWE